MKTSTPTTPRIGAGATTALMKLKVDQEEMKAAAAKARTTLGNKFSTFFCFIKFVDVSLLILAC